MSLNDLQKIQSQLNEAMQCLRAFVAQKKLVAHFKIRNRFLKVSTPSIFSFTCKVLFNTSQTSDKIIMQFAQVKFRYLDLPAESTKSCFDCNVLFKISVG